MSLDQICDLAYHYLVQYIERRYQQVELAVLIAKANGSELKRDPPTLEQYIEDLNRELDKPFDRSTSDDMFDELLKELGG